MKSPSLNTYISLTFSKTATIGSARLSRLLLFTKIIHKTCISDRNHGHRRLSESSLRIGAIYGKGVYPSYSSVEWHRTVTTRKCNWWLPNHSENFSLNKVRTPWFGPNRVAADTEGNGEFDFWGFWDILKDFWTIFWGILDKLVCC